MRFSSFVLLTVASSVGEMNLRAASERPIATVPPAYYGDGTESPSYEGIIDTLVFGVASRHSPADGGYYALSTAIGYGVSHDVVIENHRREKQNGDLRSGPVAAAVFRRNSLS